jgi:hypothetical protein
VTEGLPAEDAPADPEELITFFAQESTHVLLFVGIMIQFGWVVMYANCYRLVVRAKG